MATKSSFYADGDNSTTGVVTSNDNPNGSTGNTAAPSSFYQAGASDYITLMNAATLQAEIDADLAAAQAAANSAAASYAAILAMVGGTPGSVPFIGPSGTLATDYAAFSWDDLVHQLTLHAGASAATGLALHIPNQSGPFSMSIYNDTYSTTNSVFSYFPRNTGHMQMGVDANANLCFYTNGYTALRLALDTANNVVVNSNGTYAWSSGSLNGFSGTIPTPDTYLSRDGAGIIGQANGTNAQTFRVYNTLSGGSANYERGVFDWQTTANVLTIGTEAAGTGVARNLQFVVGGTTLLDYGVTTPGHFTCTQLFDFVIPGNSQFGRYRITGASRYGEIQFANDLNNVATHGAVVGFTGSTYAGFGGLTGEFMYMGTNGPDHFGMCTNNTFRLIITSGGVAALGGVTASYPGFINSGATMQCVLADNSGPAAFSAGTALFSGNGASGTPSVKVAGNIYVGTTPFFEIITNGGATASFSSSGTIFGINNAVGFAGNVFDFWVGGVQVFTVDYQGHTSTNNFTSYHDVELGRYFFWTGSTTLEGQHADGDLWFENNAVTNKVVLSVDGTSNVLALRNSTSAQAFRAYNTWSSAGANYERGVFDFATLANVLTIGTQNAGTGVARNMQLVVGGTNTLDYGITNASAWTFAASPRAPTPTVGDNSTKAATTAFVLANSVSVAAMRSYLSGLTLSTAGSSATFSVAAGVAADSTTAVMMSLGSSISKTTSAWAVGSGNGGLDTGAIAASTWYHVWLIERTDLTVTDVLVSLSASAPTMPANYTYKRRIGSMKTNGSSQWTAFTQNGDEFLWTTPVQALNAVASSTTAANVVVAAPTGVEVWAKLTVEIIFSTAAAGVTFYSPDMGTQACGVPQGYITAYTPSAGAAGCVDIAIRTNTSAQVAYVSSAAGASVYAVAYGWIDRRGRDA